MSESETVAKNRIEFSGVTLLEGARGHGMGAPLIKKRLRKVQKIEERNAREPCGVGSRGPP